MGIQMAGGKTVSDLLLGLYVFPSGCCFFEHTLSVLEEYIPSSVSGYSITSLQKKELQRRTIRSRGDMKELDLEMLNRRFPSNPFVEYYISNSFGPVMSISDILSEKEWQRTPLYQAAYAPYGLMHVSSIRFYADNHCYSFGFADVEPLETSCRRLLNVVAPHLETAYRTYNVQQKVLVENLPENIVLLSEKGKMRECSQYAMQVFKSYFGGEGGAKDVHLPATVGRWVESEIQSMNKRVLNTSAGKKLSVKADLSILTLRLLRYTGGYVIFMEETSVMNPGERFADLGLTLREAEVLVWLAEGKQNSEIADILKIRTGTVRKHVEHILQKLNCENRGAAALIAMQAMHQSGLWSDQSLTL
jgi:DNA-binding CsgD family transcriptional regulator